MGDPPLTKRGKKKFILDEKVSYWMEIPKISGEKTICAEFRRETPPKILIKERNLLYRRRAVC
jgi:hypothetical protein